MSKAYTTDEVKDKFLEHIHALVDWWETADYISDERTDLRHRLEGLTHSILVTLDGESELPGFLVIASPHPSDQAFNISEGANYYPAPSLENNIAGDLHETFYHPKETA